MCYEFEIVETIGKDNLKKLQQHCWPGQLYIPQTMRPDHRIAGILGFEAAKTLSAEFPGCLLNVSRSLLIRERNEQIEAACKAGIPRAWIARRYGLTARSIRKITQSITVQRARPLFGVRARNLRKVLQGPHDDRHRQQQAQSHG
jgi:hypothetical protein